MALFWSSADYPMRRGDWKRYKDKKTLRTKLTLDVHKWGRYYPYWEHEAWSRDYSKCAYIEKEIWPSCIIKVLDRERSKFKWIYTQPSYLDKPKVRKHPLTLDDYKRYGACPSWWNTLFHIRPVRRQWKHFCRVCQQSPDLVDGMPYPSHKMHKYYY